MTWRSIVRRVGEYLIAVGDAGATTPPDDPNRCAICGWPLAHDKHDGCVRGNCSRRPMPDRFYAPARARLEYGDFYLGVSRALRNVRIGRG